MTLPQGMAYGWWHFPRPLLTDLCFGVEIGAGDERTPGRYFQLYQGEIGGVGMYLGFQTDILKPGAGGQGKGLLFSRWETRNSRDAVPSPNGWIESAGHEGDFVGVRVPFDWPLGQYVCWLRPTREDQHGQWYEFVARHDDTGLEACPGSLRFPIHEGPSLIHSGGCSWTEVYNGAGYVEDVPRTHFVVHSVVADGGSVQSNRCDTDYNPSFASADCFVSNGALHLVSGVGVDRKHAPQSYEINPHD